MLSMAVPGGDRLYRIKQMLRNDPRKHIRVGTFGFMVVYTDVPLIL